MITQLATRLHDPRVYLALVFMFIALGVADCDQFSTYPK